ncbi:hypothetical protein GIB67_015226, partial [Kingdonia uniflora]
KWKGELLTEGRGEEIGPTTTTKHQGRRGLSEGEGKWRVRERGREMNARVVRTTRRSFV